MWTSMHLSKRKKQVVGKALCSSGVLVASRHGLNVPYDVVRRLPQLPRIC